MKNAERYGKRYTFLVVIFLLSVIWFWNGISGQAATEKGNIYGLVVTGYPKARNDGNLVYDRLKNNSLEGYNGKNYITRYDYNSEVAYSTDENTMTTMINRSMKGATKKDLYVFYYSGHSLSYGPKTKDVEGLSLYYADEGRITQSYSWKNLALNLNKFPGKVVVILDMCHSELFYTEGIKKYYPKSEKFYCLFASAANNPAKLGIAYNSDEKRFSIYGVFTQYMGDGLGYFTGKTLADGNSDGSISIRELYGYINKRVKKLRLNPMYWDVKVAIKVPKDIKLFSYPVILSKKSLTLYCGKKEKITAKVCGKNVEAVWKSTNTSVATVEKGIIKAKKAGKAIITARVNGKTVRCNVIVKEEKKPSPLNKKAQHKKYVSYIKAFHTKNFNAYMEWVYEGLVEPGSSEPITYFSFMDIDGDGIDECMVRFSFPSSSMTTIPLGARTELYTIQGERVKKVVEQAEYGSGRYPLVGVYKGGKLVQFETSSRKEFFTFKNGALGSRAAYSCEYVPGAYYVNGVKTTAAKFTAFLNKMTKGKVGYPMYRYSTANLNKFL